MLQEVQDSEVAQRNLLKVEVGQDLLDFGGRNTGVTSQLSEFALQNMSKISRSRELAVLRAQWRVGFCA